MNVQLDYGSLQWATVTSMGMILQSVVSVPVRCPIKPGITEVERVVAAVPVCVRVTEIRWR